MSAARTLQAPAQRPTSAPLWRRGSVLPVVSMLAVTLIGGLLPTVRTPTFYYWDDTAGVAVGVWQRIAENVLNGASPFLQLDMWRGGNFIAEAATGMWNPIMLALMVGTYPFDDVAVAITIAKMVLFLLTAGGVFVLARSFGAAPWTSAVAGAALALSGWAIFMDGSSWINGTAITAFTPWAWWALRRCVQRGFRPWDIVVAVVAGYLVPSTGNPYGFLTLAVIFLAVGVDLLAARRFRDLWWLVGIGGGTVLLLVVVYLPFLFTSAYGVRANSGVWNDEFLAVGLSDLIGMSSPTLRPWITMFGGGPMGFPGAYLAWFILPLLPWLKWSVVRDRWRSLSGLFTFGLFFLAFAIGPSQLGMFRWPARLIPFVYLAVIVLFAVVASAGLHTGRRKARGILSAATIVLGAWLAYSDVPGAWKWHVLVAVAIAAATAVVVLWAGTTTWRSFAVLAGASLLFMVPQLALTASNQNVADYRMPTSKTAMQEQFADRADGLTVQVFDIQALVGEHPAPDRWDDLLAGNMPSVAGVESTSAYTGIGFTKFDNALCLTYNGGTCADAWDALWQRPPGAQADLADLIKARYVVVLNDFADDRRAPEGWREAESTDIVTVYEREDELPFPDGTLSWTGADVNVSSDERGSGVSETVVASTGSGADTTMTFARIAWPGYTVTVDGERLDPEIGPAGLLTVHLPEGLDEAEIVIDFTPPGLVAGLAAAGAGVIVIVAILVIAVRRRRLTRGKDHSARVDEDVQAG